MNRRLNKKFVEFEQQAREQDENSQSPSPRSQRERVERDSNREPSVGTQNFSVSNNRKQESNNTGNNSVPPRSRNAASLGEIYSPPPPPPPPPLPPIRSNSPSPSPPPRRSRQANLTSIEEQQDPEPGSIYVPPSSQQPQPLPSAPAKSSLKNPTATAGSSKSPSPPPRPRAKSLDSAKEILPPPTAKYISPTPTPPPKQQQQQLPKSYYSPSGPGSSVTMEPSSRRSTSPQPFELQNSFSEDVIPLQIDIPENVTDVDAFRRYLAERRGGIPPNVDIPPFEPERQDYYDSYGGFGDSASRYINNKNRDDERQNRRELSGRFSASIHRRTLALSQAIMTLALLSATASQLRFLFAYGKAHSFVELKYILICSCILIEVVVGIGYVILARFDFRDKTLECIHSFMIFGLFIIAVSNVIIATFVIDDHICEVIAAKEKEQTTPEAAKPSIPEEVVVK